MRPTLIIPSGGMTASFRSTLISDIPQQGMALYHRSEVRTQAGPSPPDCDWTGNTPGLITTAIATRRTAYMRTLRDSHPLPRRACKCGRTWPPLAFVSRTAAQNQRSLRLLYTGLRGQRIHLRRQGLQGRRIQHPDVQRRAAAAPHADARRGHDLQCSRYRQLQAGKKLEL